MAITFLNATNSAHPVDGTATATANKPAGTTSGSSILLAYFGWLDTAGGSPSPAAGWTLVTNSRATNLFSFYDAAWYWRVADGSASYAFSATGSDAVLLAILAYDGVDNTTPIDVNAGTPASGTGTTATPNAITTVTDGCQLVYGAYDFNTVPTVPGAYTSRLSTGIDTNFGAIRLYDKSQATAGSSGADTFTTGGAGDNWVAQIIALRPTGGGGGGGTQLIVPAPRSPIFFGGSL